MSVWSLKTIVHITVHSIFKHLFFFCSHNNIVKILSHGQFEIDRRTNSCTQLCCIHNLFITSYHFNYTKVLTVVSLFPIVIMCFTYNLQAHRADCYKLLSELLSESLQHSCNKITRCELTKRQKKKKNRQLCENVIVLSLTSEWPNEQALWSGIRPPSSRACTLAPVWRRWSTTSFRPNPERRGDRGREERGVLTVIGKKNTEH